MNNVILIGAFHEIVELCVLCERNIIGIIDNHITETYMGYPILGKDADLEELSKTYSKIPILITPDKPTIRQRLCKSYLEFGFKLGKIVSPLAYVSPSAEVDDGVIIQSGSYISSRVKLGRCSKINVNANIMHDGIIGDYTTVAPNSVILGNVSIGEGCYIGSNSTILPSLSIGFDVVVGAGSVVTRHLDSSKVVKGNPAR